LVTFLWADGSEDGYAAPTLQLCNQGDFNHAGFFLQKKRLIENQKYQPVTFSVLLVSLPFWFYRPLLTNC